MANSATGGNYQHQFESVCRNITGWLLLVPEATGLLILIIVYSTTGSPRVLALFIALIIVFFTIRTSALLFTRLALRYNRLSDANALSRIAIALYPWSADALALRGTIMLLLGDACEAEQRLARAVELLPTQSSFYTAYCAALLSLGRFEKAVIVARHALNIDPANAQLYLYLAEAERAETYNSLQIEQHLRDGLAAAQTSDVQAMLHCVLAQHLIGEQRYAESALALCNAEALLAQCSKQQAIILRSTLNAILEPQ